MPLSEKALTLYFKFLEKLALEDESLTGVIQSLTILSLRQRTLVSSMPIQSNLVAGSEIPGTGTRSLPPETQAKLLKEIFSSFASIDQIMYGQARASDLRVLQELPESIQAMKNNIERTSKDLATQQKSVIELVPIILKARETLVQNIEKGLSSTLPAHSRAQSSQVDLLGATIEAALVKLALGKARAEHTLYNQTVNENATKNMARALETALNDLKTEEKAKKIELCRLDKDLKEYEAILELVDCGHEGYQQVVDDWTKVQQDTDECLRDLRRLGWTGD